MDVTTEAATITLTVDISDESGVVIDSSWKPQLGKSGSPSIQAASSWVLISGDDKDGTYQATVTVPTTAATGDYTISSSFVNDIYDNQSSYISGAGAANGGVTLLVDYAPVFTSDPTFNAEENQTAIGTVTATDEEGNSIEYSITGSEILINSSSGVIQFIDVPDYETKSSYAATVTASDGSKSATQDITVNIININEGFPVFTSEAVFSAPENQTAIGTVTATDEEGDDVTFTVSGDELSITSGGVLTFISAPDYETKATYSATVTASNSNNSSTQDITVNVTDIIVEETNEPVIESYSVEPLSLDVTNGDATLTYTVRVTDETGVDQSKLPKFETYFSANYSGTVQEHDLVLISGDKKDGTYEL